MSAISQLALPLQVAFRCKMLAIFALQLLLMLTLMGLWAFYKYFNMIDAVATTFHYADGALVALLVLLYLIYALFPLNWLVLLLFSGVQAALFAALGVEFGTHLGVFNGSAMFCCVVTTLLLPGLIAYAIVALVACALYARSDREFVTPEGFAASLAFHFALIL
ncbi:hypothetical protein PybrP1_011644 [[Pythium] brassicae (nom. inval.)]|nr:hypothetical protein PybrP1_011644 [[Pythium] brassicae (nom. inval.)]